jgi:hypothetical protein
MFVSKSHAFWKRVKFCPILWASLNYWTIVISPADWTFGDRKACVSWRASRSVWNVEHANWTCEGPDNGVSITNLYGTINFYSFRPFPEFCMFWWYLSCTWWQRNTICWGNHVASADRIGSTCPLFLFQWPRPRNNSRLLRLFKLLYQMIYGWCVPFEIDLTH